MIKPPSQLHQYTLIFSGDPALALPADEAERRRVLDLARETGRWEPLLVSGATPTLFHVRPIVGALLDWFFGEMNRRALTPAETAALALRCALRRIDNFGEHKVRLVQVDDHTIARQDTIDALYAIDDVGRVVVQEIGGVCLTRAIGGLSPKS